MGAGTAQSVQEIATGSTVSMIQRDFPHPSTSAPKPTAYWTMGNGIFHGSKAAGAWS